MHFRVIGTLIKLNQTCYCKISAKCHEIWFEDIFWLTSTHLIFKGPINNYQMIGIQE